MQQSASFSQLPTSDARIVLGIESSCDETAVALVRADGVILAQALRTQLTEHAPYGGVVPEIAARAHLAHIDALYRQCLDEAGKTIADVDAIAVTAGPGLIGGVIVGVMVGKALAAAAHKPLIAVNHLEGHALTVRLTHHIAFPYFLLLASGGHCQMLVVHGVGKYTLLGQTKDDALGEAFDKCAKMLGLGYPGGAEIERVARAGDAAAYAFPRPMAGTDSLDFSFSGLKTAVRLVAERELVSSSPLAERGDTVANIAASFQQAAFEAVRDRVTRGLAVAQASTPAITALAVAGGVAANQRLRELLHETAVVHHVPLVVAPPALCTDNAAMIAWAGVERLQLGLIDNLDIAPKARWPLVNA